MKRPALIRELSTVAILASALLGVPALACQNPALSAPGVASTLGLSDRPRPDAPVAGATVADYLPVTGDSAASVIGMWHAVFRLGDASGPVYDEVFEQFHSDGTELIISSGLPPALGNVCVGVWKRVAARTYKLRHMTWNWAPPDNGFGVPGTFAGHFELEVTLRLDAHGQHFNGTFSARNFDTEGEHIPGLDAQGVVNGVRITVD